MRCAGSAPSCCRSIANVDDVVGLEHIYGCGVAIEADDAEIPIRTLRNISFNPNFGGGTMVVSLGCEKLQPERLLPAGVARGRGTAGARDYDLVTLQDPSHVGFDAMVASIMRTAEQHLAVSTGAGARPARPRRWWSACSAAAATRSPA